MVAVLRRLIGGRPLHRAPYCCDHWLLGWCYLDVLLRCRVRAVCDRHERWIVS